MNHCNFSELTTVFLRLGLTAFGGPVAHIAMMRSEFVDKRRWLTNDEFLKLFAVTNLIPGPNSTEMAIHLGYKMRWCYWTHIGRSQFYSSSVNHRVQHRVGVRKVRRYTRT